MKRFALRSVSLLLCAVIMLSGAVCAFAKEERETYTGKVLMAVNTDANYLFCDNGCYSFDLSNLNKSVKGQTEEKNASGKSAPDVIDDIEIASPDEYEAYLKAHKNEPQALIHNEYKAGDTKKINISYKDNNGNSRITVKCICIGRDCTVWTQVFDDGSLYDTEEAAKEAADFYDSVHKAEEEVFGKNLIDTDGDGKFAIISYDIDHEENLGGYVIFRDLANTFGFIDKVFAPSDALIGNHMDCVYMHGLHNESTLVHEYQHYLFGCNEYFGKTNFDYISGAESFVNEGFSRCAEVIFADYNLWIGSAMERAGDISLIDWEFDYDCYTISGAFCNYLRNRYAILTNDKSEDFAGKDFYLEYHSRRNLMNQLNSMEIFGDLLYPADKYPELKSSEARAKQLLIDFWKAVLLREETGIHGFNGEDIVRGSYIEEELPAETETLGAGMAKFYVTDYGKKADAVIKSKSDNIYFEALDVEGICEITFDYNYEGAPEPERVFLLTDDETFPLEFRDGYNLIGWSENKDAKEADYTPYETIKAVNDTVYYAVWKEWPVVEEETEYGRDLFPETGYVYNAFFTPEETAYYSVIMRYCNVSVYEEDGYNRFEPCYEGYDYKGGKSEATYHLTGGKKYSISIYNYARSLDSDASFRFSIVRETGSFKLTFVTDGESFINPYEGKTEYYLPWAGGDFDKAFTGWSLKKDAETPDYKAGELLKLTEDTTLYAVYKPNTVITGDGEYKTGEDDYYIIFNPESSGTYSITCSESGTVWIKDENHKNIGEFSGSGEGVFAAGHKYYFEPDNIASFTVKKVSGKTETELKIVDRDGNELYTDKGKAFYTVPDIEPEDNYEGEFIEFWGPRGGAYESGDTVFVLNEAELTPEIFLNYCHAGETWVIAGSEGAYITAFNKKDNRRYFFFDADKKGLYRVKAKGGLAYYEELPDSEDNILWNNTDDGCYVYMKNVDEKIIIMLDPGVTEFTIEKIEGDKTVTFSADGASNVPDSIVTGGLAYIPGTVPDKDNEMFYGWLYTYTFRGEECNELIAPDSIFLVCEDTVLTAEFTRLTLLERILNWILEHIFTPLLELLS